MDVGFIDNGDYIKVKGVAFGTGATSFNVRVASATSGGKIELHLDSTSGTLVGTCTIAGTGGWQTWTTVSCPVTGATGTHDLYLKFTGGSGSLFNLNWWQFIDGGSSPSPSLTPTPTPTSPSPSPTSPSPSPTSPSSSPQGGTGCTATYQVTSSWTGGFQVNVDVKNIGSAALTGWTARWTLPSGQAISSLWNGTLSVSGSNVTVTNASYNGALAAGASTTFGFLGSGTLSGTPTATCAAS